MMFSTIENDDSVWRISATVQKSEKFDFNHPLAKHGDRDYLIAFKVMKKRGKEQVEGI